MDISLIICTYNRSESLKETLASIALQAIPKSMNWEVLIVDNNSTDQTATAANQYCESYPNRFRYVFEKEQGKSCALNRGIREAKGSVLAFTDDDVIADPDWLRNLTLPLKDPNWSGVGGRIVAPQDFAPPAWLPLDGQDDLGGILALFDKGREGAELMEAPFGANVAYRKAIFQKCGLFRPDLGPCPGSEIRGEDTEFGRRVLKSGERLWYEPSAIVHHAVPLSRLQKSYFLRFQYDQGRASIREKDLASSVFFLPRCYLVVLKIALCVLSMRTIAWLFSHEPRRRFQRKCMVWTNLGQLAELAARIRRGEIRRGELDGENRPPALASDRENHA